MPKATLRKDGRWTIALPRVSGKSRQFAYGKTPELALDDYNRRMGIGQFKVRPGSIAEFYVLHFTEWFKKRVSTDSFNRYDSAWCAVTGPKLGDKKWTELTVPMVDEAFASGGTSDRVLAKTHLLKMAELAIGLKQACPAEVPVMIKLVKVPTIRAKKRFNIGDVAAKMLRAAEDLNHWTEGFIYVSSILGTRKGEVCAIKRGDIDIEAGTLTISRQRNHTEGEREKLKGRDQGETRVIGLPEPILRRMLSYFRPGAIYLVTDPKGKPPPTNHFDRYLSAVEEKAGVKCTPHDFRSAAICNLVDAGVPDATIMDIVGHGSLAMIRWYRDQKAQRSRDGLARLTSTDNHSG
jgi:integrase